MIQDYPDCFLCGKECDENYTIIDNEYVCTECNNSDDNKYHYGSIENLVKDIKQPKKKCCVCKNHKNITEFYKNKSKSDGYSNMCKSCRKEYQKEYRKTDKYKEYQKTGKHKNLDSYYKVKLKEKGFSKEQINENPELINIQKLIIKTKRLCKTSAN